MRFEISQYDFLCEARYRCKMIRADDKDIKNVKNIRVYLIFNIKGQCKHMEYINVKLVTCDILKFLIILVYKVALYIINLNSMKINKIIYNIPELQHLIDR